MKRIFFLFTLIFSAVNIFAQDAKTFTIATYNVQGLPTEILEIDFSEFGWPGSKYTREIGEHIESEKWDIVAFNEDFNYHDDLVSTMPSYNFMTHTGKFKETEEAVRNLFDGFLGLGLYTERYRFTIDGLGFATRNNYTISDETIVPWNKDAIYGYFDHDNDSITSKGFRYYNVTLDNDHTIGVVALHADAGEWIEDSRARKNGFRQLYDFLMTNNNVNFPLIMLGDFNCKKDCDTSKGETCDDHLSEWTVQLFNENNGFSAHDLTEDLNVKEQTLDRIMYVNKNTAAFYLQPKTFEIKQNFKRSDPETESGKVYDGQLSDHKPLVATFEIVDNTSNNVKSLNASQCQDVTAYELSGIVATPSTPDFRKILVSKKFKRLQ